MQTVQCRDQQEVHFTVQKDLCGPAVPSFLYQMNKQEISHPSRVKLFSFLQAREDSFAFLTSCIVTIQENRYSLAVIFRRFTLVCVCVSYVSVWVHATCMLSDPLELELHVVGRHFIWVLRTQPCPLEDQQVLLATESSLQASHAHL